jgi:hypothetical protein
VCVCMRSRERARVTWRERAHDTQT